MEQSYLFSSRLCTAHPGRPAIVGNGKSCTYEEMHRGIAGLSRKLREMGVAKDTRVALWGYNTAEWLIAFFAVQGAGLDDVRTDRVQQSGSFQFFPEVHALGV